MSVLSIPVGVWLIKIFGIARDEASSVKLHDIASAVRILGKMLLYDYISRLIDKIGKSLGISDPPFFRLNI